MKEEFNVDSKGECSIAREKKYEKKKLKQTMTTI